jgi:hypothetical protein
MLVKLSLDLRARITLNLRRRTLHRRGPAESPSASIRAGGAVSGAAIRRRLRGTPFPAIRNIIRKLADRAKGSEGAPMSRHLVFVCVSCFLLFRRCSS